MSTQLVPSKAQYQADLAARAPLASPAFTGTPTAPTAPSGTNTSQVATTAHVKAVVDALLNGAGPAYDTLKELQDLLVNDETAATALAALVDTRAITGTNVITAAGTLIGSKRNTVDASAGAFAVTLPAPAKVGQLLLVERVDSSTTAAVTITGVTGATLRGDAAGTIVMPGVVGAPYEGLLFVAESLTSWAPLAGHKPKTWLDTVYIARTGFQGIRARDLPGIVNLPGSDTSQATVSLTAANTATSISGGVKIATTRQAYRPLGGEPIFDRWMSSWTSTEAGGIAFEFDLITAGGVFEPSFRGQGGKVAVLVNGKYVTAKSGIALTNDGNEYKLVVTLAAGAGTYRIRLEVDGNQGFYGVFVGPTDSVTAASKRPLRAIWVGDSFSSPTFSESAAYSQALAMVPTFGWCTGWDVIPAGRSSTGLANPGSSVKYADRLSELFTVPNVDVMIIQMSGNDQSQTTAAVVAQAQNVINLCRAAGFTKYGQIIFLSSWWIGRSQSIPTSLIDKNDQVQALCKNLGVVFVDALIPAIRGGLISSLSAAVTAGTSAVNVPDKFPVSPLADPTQGELYIQIGNPSAANIEIRRVTSSSGSGPSGIAFTPGLTYAHAAGETVKQVGKYYVTGTGRVGNLQNDGTADRAVGSDGTHPTLFGHLLHGMGFAARLQEVLDR